MRIYLRCDSNSGRNGDRDRYGEYAELTTLPNVGDTMVVDGGEYWQTVRYRVLEVLAYNTARHDPSIVLAPLYNIVDRQDGFLVRDHRLWNDGRWTSPRERRNVGEWTVSEWHALNESNPTSIFDVAYVPAT